MERLAKIEAEIDHVRTGIAELKGDVRDLRKDVAGIRTTDFRLLFAAIIGLAGVMAKGFGWL